MELNIPNHVGIIMDGNGRWATKRGLPRIRGHLKGSKALIKIAPYILDKGVKVLSVFAFSTENFKRSKEEVDYLMDLFVKTFKTQFKVFKDKNIKVIFSGRKENLPEKVINTMENIEKETINNHSGIFNICINYGGRSEIVDSIKKIIDSKENVNEETFKKHLYNDLPDIDLLIRTSGEMRISNFMLYQCAYAELYFTDTYWPDFNEKDFDEAINAYNNRNRRFGGV